jgi:hypothetical protein
MEEDKLLASPFFFRFAIPCRLADPVWGRSGIQLDESYRLPRFATLDQPAGTSGLDWADVRLAWGKAGIAFNVTVTGKEQPPWCRETRIEDSDRISIWIDTRNTPDIHRANRFCHAFHFLPASGTARSSAPLVRQVRVERAREIAPLADDQLLQVRSKILKNGYRLEGFIPREALTGFDPSEQPQIGFMYAVIDRELGKQTMTVGEEFPYHSDPSLWSTVDLVE